MVAGAVVATSKKRFDLSLSKRTRLIETLYLDHLNSSVCLELATEGDLNVVADYLCTANEHNEEHGEYGTQKINNALKGDESFTIVTIDHPYICGVLNGTVIDHDKAENQPNTMFQDLPSNTKRFFHINFLDVDQAYRCSGLGTQLWTEGVKLAIKSNCRYITAMCPPGKPMTFASKMGMLRLSAPTKTNSKDVAYLMVYDLNESTGLLKNRLITHVPGAYRLKEAERQVIYSVFSKQLKREIKFEVALLDDMRVLHNYAVNEFFKQTPVFISLGLQKEDTMELAKLRLSPKVISEERVLMVTDDSQLIGFVVCSSALSDRNKQKHDRSSTDIIDLTEEIDNVPIASKAIAKARAINNHAYNQIPFYFPSETGSVCIMEMGHLYPTYRHAKIGIEMGVAFLMFSYNKGYRWVTTISTSAAAYKSSALFGAKLVYDCLYSRFVYKDERIFREGTVFDGHDRLSIYACDLTAL